MEENPETLSSQESSALGAFLAQPDYHAEEDVEDVRDEAAVGAADALSGGSRIARIRDRLRHFLFEKSPSQYSSIAPRLPDGRRARIFFFNGNGRGR